MMSDPVTWLDALVLIAAYLLASLAWRAVERIQRARGTFEDITTETGDEAAPDRQDGGTADPSRAVCNDPAASSPADLPLDCHGEGHALEDEVRDCRTCTAPRQAAW